jgi:hypothetical protein
MQVAENCDVDSHTAYLSRETVRWLKTWLQHAGIVEGAVFQRLIGRTHIGGPLNSGSIAPIFKCVAQWIGLPARTVGRVSGHSLVVVRCSASSYYLSTFSSAVSQANFTSFWALTIERSTTAPSALA